MAQFASQFHPEIQKWIQLTKLNDVCELAHFFPSEELDSGFWATDFQNVLGLSNVDGCDDVILNDFRRTLNCSLRQDSKSLRRLVSKPFWEIGFEADRRNRNQAEHPNESATEKTDFVGGRVFHSVPVRVRDGTKRRRKIGAFLGGLSARRGRRSREGDLAHAVESGAGRG
eukprot:TRINITY_DN37856_c0_g1_i1.p1 TRINITY_DN37856_c0_g1~~TRINITY_DN37856_c0_g1_i1.p1  ORF type:complete len:178 (+),score=24.47 TRINITY_DN37856_c0_g1_i1:23-535(+)